MTVDHLLPVQPLDDTPVPNVLVISENGEAYQVARKLQNGADVVYFQRTRNGEMYKEPGISHADSWRPHVTDADVLVVDDPTLAWRLRDADTKGKVILYLMSDKGMDEVTRLANWLNPLTQAMLEKALGVVDVYVGEVTKRPWWKFWGNNA